MDNPVLETIKSRRSVFRFETTPVKDEELQAILEAGRWAPSWLNSQPWRFLCITDKETKKNISDNVPTAFRAAIIEAPVSIAVFVDPKEDPYHFVEDGASATENMALAAKSLGLGSCWIGVFDREDKKDSSEAKIKAFLNAPKNYRLISILPIGVPKQVSEKTRKELSQLVYREKF
ncbi:MAG: nitroreductase family protein [Candidatus Bathyarchaeia archaeon]